MKRAAISFCFTETTQMEMENHFIYMNQLNSSSGFSSQKNKENTSMVVNVSVNTSNGEQFQSMLHYFRVNTK